MKKEVKEEAKVGDLSSDDVPLAAIVQVEVTQVF